MLSNLHEESQPTGDRGGGHRTSLGIVSVWESLTRATVFFVPKFGRKATRFHLRGETIPDACIMRDCDREKGCRERREMI